MTCKQIRRPDVSYAAPAASMPPAAEGGRGSLQVPSTTTAGEQELEVTKRRSNNEKTLIPRRRTPTVMVLPVRPPARESQHGSYKTIEKKGDHTLLQFSHKPYESTTHTNTRGRNWFCRWMDYEHLDLSAIATCPGPSTSGSGDGDRSRLHTPMEGLRSASGGGSRVSSSRYSSSRGGGGAVSGGRRGRGEEQQRGFQHYTNVGVYMEEYRRLHCYTTLSSAPSLRDDERVFCEGEDVQQDGDGTLPLGVKSLYRGGGGGGGGDQYVRELASRIGVSDLSDMSWAQDWERQQQLIQNPRPTPPSIVKRKRGRDVTESVDIVVSNSTSKR